jgi:hypothetical protein
MVRRALILITQDNSIRYVAETAVAGRIMIVTELHAYAGQGDAGFGKSETVL